MTQDWKDFYRMPFVAAYRKWDADVYKSWKNRLVLELEHSIQQLYYNTHSLYIIPLVQSEIIYFTLKLAR